MSESFVITIEPLGRQVVCRDDQPILDACLRAGVWLPHSCTHGTCATCKCDMVEGEIDHGAASSFALMDFERGEGKLLTCCATPRSDVTIEVDIDVDEDLEMFPVEDYVGTLVEKTEIAKDTVRLVVDLDREIAFNAGQYMKFTVPAAGDGSAPSVDRTWSIASPPTEAQRLEFHVRLVPGGRGTDGWVFKDLEPGQQFPMSGPYGRDLVVIDSVLAAEDIACPETSLEPGATMICTAQVPGIVAGGSHVDTATVTGTPTTASGAVPLDKDGQPLSPVTASDIAHAYAAPAPPALPTTGTEAGTLGLVGVGLLGLGSLLLLVRRRRTS